MAAIHRRASSRRQWLANLRTRASDGAILVTTVSNPELRSLHVPVVVIDPAGTPDLDVPTIGATNWAGGVSATEHLIGLGHGRIGHVAGLPDLWCSRARLNGYRAGLETAGLPYDPDLVTPGDFDYESGFSAGRRLLDLAEPPTAVFAANDQMALDLVEAVRRAGRRVPDDVSVVGFDDLPETRWSSPPLTTVRQSLVGMGRLAVRMVLDWCGARPWRAPRWSWPPSWWSATAPHPRGPADEAPEHHRVTGGLHDRVILPARYSR